MIVYTIKIEHYSSAVERKKLKFFIFLKCIECGCGPHSIYAGFFVGRRLMYIPHFRSLLDSKSPPKSELQTSSTKWSCINFWNCWFIGYLFTSNEKVVNGKTFHFAVLFVDCCEFWVRLHFDFSFFSMNSVRIDLAQSSSSQGSPNFLALNLFFLVYSRIYS